MTASLPSNAFRRSSTTSPRPRRRARHQPVRRNGGGAGRAAAAVLVAAAVVGTAGSPAIARTDPGPSGAESVAVVRLDTAALARQVAGVDLLIRQATGSGAADGRIGVLHFERQQLRELNADGELVA